MVHELYLNKAVVFEVEGKWKYSKEYFVHHKSQTGENRKQFTEL